MKIFYSLVVLSGALQGKELTLPAGRYTVYTIQNKHNDVTPDKNNITLDIRLDDPSLNYIEIILSDTGHTLFYLTNKNKLITTEINYNEPFIYRNTACLALKPSGDNWSGAVQKYLRQGSPGAGKKSIFYRRIFTFLLILLCISLVTLWLNNKKTDEKHYHSDIRTTINHLIGQYDYIQNGHQLLLITPSGKTIPEDISQTVKPWVINTLSDDNFRKHPDDIINIKISGKIIDVIYIGNENIINTTNLIPDVFRQRIQITYYSFNDIIRTINNIIGEEFSSYAIALKKNRIIIQSTQEKNDDTRRIIELINETLFNTHSDLLILYQQIKKPADPPGIYGKYPYRIMPGEHLDFTPHNK